MKYNLLKNLGKTVALFAVVGATCAFVACGNNATADKNATEDNTSKTESNATSASSSDENTLNLYTWAGMFPQDVLDSFTKDTGIKINYSNFDTDEEMLSKVSEEKAGTYDLVFADDYIIPSIIKNQLATPLSDLKIDNLDNINPEFQHQYYDKEDKYTIPYGAGIPLIVYNPSEVKEPITGYSDLWKPEFKDSLAIVANYRVIDGMALKTMKESFNCDDVAKIDEAGKKLKELAPNIRLISDSNTQDSLLSGEVKAAFLYTSQVNTALSQNKDLKVTYPKEGLGYGIIAGFVPSNSKHSTAAAKFLQYILQPKVGAKCFENTQYYCTFKASEPYIAKEMQQTLVPPVEIKTGEIIEPLSEQAEAAALKIFNEFKDACQ